MASNGIIWWQQAAVAADAESEETKIERRGGDIYGRGRGWVSNNFRV